MRNIKKKRATDRVYARAHRKAAAIRHRKWVMANPEKMREAHLKFRYGITLNYLLMMKKQQGSKCAICRRKKRLVIDHNHKTGQIRGLLCDDCNVGIGRLQDDRRIVQLAADYLKGTS